MIEQGLGPAVERASLRAWPGIEEQEHGRWTLRFSVGFTGRANSVQSVCDGRESAPCFEERVTYCERWYRQRGRPSLFRMTPFSQEGLDAFLERRGYDRLNRTLVLHRPTSGLLAPELGLRLEATELYEWLRRYATLTGSPTAPAPMRRIVERIAGRTLMCTLWADHPGRAVACGLGVLDGALLGLFDLVVDPEVRRRGYGEALVRSLVGWGAGGGAADVYLQVTEDNAPALGLYAKLGFGQLYEYWYRIRSS